MAVALGTTSRRSSSRFGSSATFKLATPVRLPPRWLRLATNPRSTGSTPMLKTTGMVVVAAFAATAAGDACPDDHSNPSAHQIGR